MPKKKLPPAAAALMQSIRGVGYDVKSAIADLIDNSIAARADSVHVCFLWDGAGSTVTILDDGEGMDYPTLERAMTLGSRNPSEERDVHDLGRFGLGLKTASLSQCTRLVVASRRSNGVTSALVWDLQMVSAYNEWLVHDELTQSEQDLVSQLQERESGTLVIWSQLDRLVGKADPADEKALRHFQQIARDTETHLAMVFHRYIEGRPPRLRLYLNGDGDEHRIKPWDPFCTENSATQILGEARRAVHGRPIILQGYVLPHKDRFKNAEDFERAGGPGGWGAQQGFYVYRADRLLVAGSWLGLGSPRRWTRDEQHKLARISLQISNALDGEWAIDVKKSKADPPLALRDWLTRNASQVRGEAREVFVHRGGTTISKQQGTFCPLWFANGGAAPQYRINRDHPAVSMLLKDETAAKGKIENLLRLLESTVPIHRIWLDVAEKPEIPPPTSEQLPIQLVEKLANDLAERFMAGHGITRSEAIARLRTMEPFDQFPVVLASLTH